MVIFLHGHFASIKIISTGGEGGMISTNYKKLYLRMWSLKDHGKKFSKVFYKSIKLDLDGYMITLDQIIE